MTLFEECLSALNTDVTIISDKILLKKINSLLFGNISGSIDWKKYKNVKEISNVGVLSDNFNNVDFYIIWDEYNLPILKSNINSILKNIDDILCVAFDTFLISNDLKFIVEFSHTGKITTGTIAV